MSQITLTVGGRAFPVSCADGEEDHVRRLAAVVDGKMAGASANDAQNLLFAALILADEAEEARRGAPSPAGQRSARAPDGDDAAAFAQLDALAQRIESLADMLEKAARSA